MRILVVGAGAIGGYFGGRLLQAGRDVTFLVRPRRAQQLRDRGLGIRSAAGNVDIANPPVVQADELRSAFDLVVLSCKSYDLEAAIESFAPAVGPQTSVLPLLNGMGHLDTLEAKFGSAAVLGGQCFISAALNADGSIQHLNESHTLTFGERSGGSTPRVRAIQKELSGAGFDASPSETILQDMWEKWIFIAAMAGLTCLMRASIGDVLAADGPGIPSALLNECAQIAGSAGFAPRDAAVRRGQSVMTASGSTMMASMLRDIERGAQTEVEHILGDLVRRQNEASQGNSLLRLAYVHVKSYEARRAREALAAGATTGRS
ncbi:MAG: 2-dehydropantoate 2-reductase [Gammaproteobacteria bacterium]